MNNINKLINKIHYKYNNFINLLIDTNTTASILYILVDEELKLEIIYIYISFSSQIINSGTKARESIHVLDARSFFIHIQRRVESRIQEKQVQGQYICIFSFYYPTRRHLPN